MSSKGEKKKQQNNRKEKNPNKSNPAYIDAEKKGLDKAVSSKAV